MESGPYVGSAQASQSMVLADQDCIHLIDFLLLGNDDVAAQGLYFGIPDRCLLAHQDRARVMRDHGSQKLIIADQCLRPHPEQRQQEQAAERDIQDEVGSPIREHGGIIHSMKSAIDVTIISVM